MKRIPAADLVRNFSLSSDEALAQPIVVTRNGRDRLIMVSIEHYRHVLSIAILAAEIEQADLDELRQMLVFVG